MSTDYAEKEREFLATLEDDTGRSLTAWMAAITAERLSGKNDVIDWLRGQGFMFWKASWLERIHSNGGRPIYTGGEAPVRIETEPPRAAPSSVPPAEPQSEDHVEQVAEPAPQTEVARPAAPAAGASELEELLARAKALAPLARHVVREINRAVPLCETVPSHNALVFRTGRDFAVLAIGPKELKLGLALGPAAIAAPFVAARFPAPAYRVPGGMTHMIALSDVRQVGPELAEAIAKAAAQASQ